MGKIQSALGKLASASRDIPVTAGSFQKLPARVR
jgi:hypothetical protein